MPAPQGMLSGIFISYSRKDLKFAQKVFVLLEDLGYRIWIDIQSIPPTAEFLKEILKGIEDMDFFVFIISPNSVSSEICNIELNHAIHHNKRIIPILCETTDPALVPNVLRQIHWIDWCNKDETSGTEKLKESLSYDVKWLHQHTDLLSRALEWEKQGKPSSLLLRAGSLADAEAWLIEGAWKESRPTSLQIIFIEESRSAQHRNKRNGIIIGIVSLLVLMILTGLVVFRTNQARLATFEEQKQNAFRVANALALKSQQVGETDVDLGILLALKSIHLTYDQYGEISSESSQALYMQVLENAFKGQLTGHVAPVQSFTVSPDGNYFLTGGYDSQTFLWGSDGSRKLLLEGHTGPVVTLSFSPDSQHFLTADANGNQFLWNIDGSLVYQFPEKEAKLLHAGFHPTENIFILIYTNGQVEVWDSESMLQKQFFLQTQPSAAIRNIAFDETGDRFLVTWEGGGISLWALKGGRLFERVMSSTVTASSLSARRGLILLGLENGNAELLDDQGQTILEFKATLDESIIGEDVQSVAINPKYNLMLTGGNDNVARLWNMDGTLVTSIEHSQRVLFVDFAPDGRRFFTQSLGSAIMAWDLQGSPLFTLPGGPPLVFIDSTTLATGNGTGMSFLDSDLQPFRVLTTDGEQVKSVQMNQNGILMNNYVYDGNGAFTGGVFGWNAKFSPDGTKVVTGMDEGMMVWDTNSDLLANKLTSIKEPTFDFPIWLDDYTILTADDKGNAYLWFWEERRYLEFAHHQHQIRSADFKNDLIASVDTNDIIYLWDKFGNVITSFDSGHGGGTSIVFMPDGNKIVTNGNDQMLKFWDLDGNLVLSLPDVGTLPFFSPDGNLVVIRDYHQDVSIFRNTQLEVVGQIDGIVLAFSPDGQYLLVRPVYTPQLRNVLEVWSITGDRLVELKGHSQKQNIAIIFSGFNSDGTMVITSSNDGEIRLWDLKGEVLAILTVGESDLIRLAGDKLLVVQGTSAKLISPLLPLEEMLLEAERRVGRSLTTYECQFYVPELPCP